MLTAGDIDALADALTIRLVPQVVELLRQPTESQRPAELVDARTIAVALGVSVKSVYRHAEDLGAVRVGRRLRFDFDQARRSWLTEQDDRCPSERSQPLLTPAPKRTLDTGQRPTDTAHCRLLPVGRRTGEL